DADPQVHVRTVAQLRGGDRRHLVSGPGHLVVSSRSCRGRIGVVLASGSDGVRDTGTRGALFDVLVLAGGHHQPLDVDARGDDMVGVDLAIGDDLLDLRDGDTARGRDDRIEVAGGVAVGEVAGLVGTVGPDQGDVGDETAFHDVLDTVEDLRRLPLGDLRPHTGAGVAGPYTGATGTPSLGELVLRVELDLQLVGEVLRAEALVLAHLGGAVLADLAFLDAPAQSGHVDTYVVGDVSEIADT